MQCVEQNNSFDNETRCLGRRKAVELSLEEIQAVSGGAVYTMIKDIRRRLDGTIEISYGDSY